MGWTEKIRVVICILYNVMDIVNISIMTVELPQILLRPYVISNNGSDANSSWTGGDGNSWQQPGVVLSLNNLSAVLFSSLIGILTSKYNSRYILCCGLLMHAIGSLSLALNETFPFLVFGVFFDGFGRTIGAVSNSDVLRIIFPDDRSRCRIMNICGLARVFGYACAFFLGTLSYEIFGYAVTFGAICGVHTTLTLMMLFASISTKLAENTFKRITDEETPLKDRQDVTNISKEKKKSKPAKKAYWTSIPTLSLCVHAFITHYSIAMVMATAPERLQLQVGFTPVENGFLIGASLFITFLVVFVLLLIVKTNLIRVICIIAAVVIEIVGLATYSYVWTFELGLFSQTCIDIARNSLNANQASLLMLISDIQNIDYAKANGLYLMFRYGSQTVGNFTSVFLLEWLGFEAMYLLLVGCLVPVALSSIMYFRLV